MKKNQDFCQNLVKKINYFIPDFEKNMIFVKISEKLKKIEKNEKK